MLAMFSGAQALIVARPLRSRGEAPKTDLSRKSLEKRKMGLERGDALRAPGRPGADNVSDIIESSVDTVISIPHMRKMRDGRYRERPSPDRYESSRLMAEREADRVAPIRRADLQHGGWPKPRPSPSRAAAVRTNRPPEKGAEENSTNARRTQDVRFGTTAAQTKLLRLLERHRAEWSAFVNSLPERSWVGDIVARL